MKMSKFSPKKSAGKIRFFWNVSLSCGADRVAVAQKVWNTSRRMVEECFADTVYGIHLRVTLKASGMLFGRMAQTSGVYPLSIQAREKMCSLLMSMRLDRKSVV